MAQPIITVEHHFIDWPVHQPLDQATLLRQLGVHADDGNGQDLTSKVVLNLTQVQVNQVGQYPVIVSVMDARGQSAQTSVTLNVVEPKREAADSHPRHRRRWLWVVLLALVIICAWWAVETHHQQVAQQTATDSQVSQNSNSISQLSKDNQKLANQVAQLKGATQQYQQDHDQQALLNRLDQIQSQTQQLKSQVSDSSVKQDLNQVDSTVNEIRQNPDNGNQLVNDLKNKGNFSEIWSSIGQQVQKWLNEFSSESN